jgi:hypothetical protein
MLPTTPSTLSYPLVPISIESPSTITGEMSLPNTVPIHMFSSEALGFQPIPPDVNINPLP